MTLPPENGMLPLVVRPVKEESVLGLIGRQADALCASFNAMRQYLGIGASFMLSDEQWTRLADALGADEATLSGMRRREVRLGRESGAIHMLGQTLRYHLVVHGSLRICPACLAEGRPILERWDIAHAPVCLRHTAQLVDTCRCGKPLSPHSRGGRLSSSCPCGLPFATLDVVQARPGLMTMGRIVDEVISGRDPDELDPVLRGLPLSDILSIAHVVGVAVTTPAAADQHVEPRGAVYGSVRVAADLANVANMADLVEATVPCLLSWSDSYTCLLSEVACRNEAAGTDDADSIFATAIGRTLRRPPRGIDGIPLACMTEAVELFCQEKHSVKPRKTSHRRDSPVGRKIARHLSRSKLAATIGVAPQAPSLMRIFDGVVRQFDDEDFVSCHEAKDLADLVEREVLRRWNNTQDTVSLDRAVRSVSHPTSTHRPSDWMIEELLVPVDESKLGIDDVLVRRRGGRNFLKADVDALIGRIASRVALVRSEAEMVGFEIFARCRKFHGGGWPRIEFMKAFLDGRIRARSTIERPKLAEVWFEMDAVRDLALEHRVRAVLEKDVFAVAHRCRTFVTAVWGRHPDHFTDYHLRHLRRTKAVRFVDVRNTTEGRDRPLYHFSLSDLLERAALLQGPSLSPLADKILQDYRHAKKPKDRVILDDEQRKANAYIAGIASHMARTITNPGTRLPAPNADLPTIPGWRRTGDRQHATQHPPTT